MQTEILSHLHSLTIGITQVSMAAWLGAAQGQFGAYLFDIVSHFSLLITFAGLLVGLLIGLTGVGGGVLLTPILVFLGVPPTTAVGTDLFYGSLTKLVGSYQHWKQRSIDWRWVRLMAYGSVPMAVVATYLIQYSRQHYGSAEKLVKTGLGFVMILAAIGTLVHDIYRKRHAQNENALAIDPEKIKIRVILFGATIGFLVGLTSVGSGSLIAIGLLMFSGLSSKMIVGTDIAHALLLVTAGAIAHWQIGTVNVPLAANLLLGSLPGVMVGSKLAYLTPSRPLRVVVAILILAGGFGLIRPIL